MGDLRTIIPAAGLVFLVACPATTQVVGGSTAGGDGTSTSGTGPDLGDGSGDGDGDGLEHRSYFIGESSKFDGGGSCDNVDVNVVTKSLREELDDAGWTGTRLVEDDSWPEHFRESSTSFFGLDETFADAATLAVFAGHGSAGQLQWGRPSDNGLCVATINTTMRLGRLAGDTAAAVMFVASCTMRMDVLWSNYKEQASRQFLGFHDGAYVGSGEPRKVFVRSADGQPTADAWLEEMVLNGGGKNSPVVLTMGTSPGDASGTHGIVNLASGEGLIPNVGEPVTNFRFEMFDSGCTKRCGNCDPNAAPLPEPMLSAPVHRLILTRPQRSASELIEHAAALLAVFELGDLEPETKARLEAWAAAIVTRRDVAWVQLLDEPRVDLSYDPSADLLRITNRDALAEARPGPGEVLDDPPELGESLEAQAALVLDELQATPGALDMLGSSFEVTTRALADGSEIEPQPEPLAFEYIFARSGELDGLALPDRSLGIGLTRLGELSSLTISAVEVELGDALGYQRAPQEALDALRDAVLAANPGALGLEFIAPRIGYQLAEDEATAELDPSLVVGYVLGFGPEAEPVASRRIPVRVSLVAPGLLIEPIGDADPASGGTP